MSEIIRKRLKENIGKVAIIFMKSNNFRYEGPINEVDDIFVEIYDKRSEKNKIISYDEIKEIVFSDDDN